QFVARRERRAAVANRAGLLPPYGPYVYWSNEPYTRRSVNVAPWPSVLSADKAPPRSAASARGMESPRPVPPNRRERAAQMPQEQDPRGATQTPPRSAPRLHHRPREDRALCRVRGAPLLRPGNDRVRGGPRVPRLARTGPLRPPLPLPHRP